MDIKSPVIVTALYDIGRDNWEKFTQSYGGYLHWMERTLSIDNPIVIYTQEKFKDEITAIRSNYDPEFTNTKIIIQELEELEVYKLYFKKLDSLMGSQTFIDKTSFDVPEMNRPLYNVIMFNKIFWLQHAVQNKFFNNDLVIWADAGGLREEIEKYSNIKWPSLDKINNLDNNKITFFSHNDDFNIEEQDKEFYALSQIRNIQGTAFAAPSHLVESLLNDFTYSIDESLERGYIGSDEKIFDFTFVRDKLKYYLIKCTWREYFSILS